VTRRGTDPLLPAEENTADLVEPPTQDELNHAITGNFSNLMTVVCKPMMNDLGSNN
jgi:calcium/calmodulin-dependent protein kinase kinase 2